MPHWPVHLRWPLAGGFSGLGASRVGSAIAERPLLRAWYSPDIPKTQHARPRQGSIPAVVRPAASRNPMKVALDKPSWLQRLKPVFEGFDLPLILIVLCMWAPA